MLKNAHFTRKDCQSLHICIYRTAFNLMDISNYPDTISNYFLSLITLDSQ